MPPRFLERINKKNDTVNAVFGNIPHRPHSRTSRISVSTSEKSSESLPPQQSDSVPTPPSSYLQNERNKPSDASLALPKGSLILVTGANSFLGSHIVDQLLKFGYCVRGTVRDIPNAEWTTRYFQDKYGANRYSSSIVPDMAVKGAFNLAIQGCSGVIHVASVTSLDPDPNTVIMPSIAGALNALEAAESRDFEFELEYIGFQRCLGASPYDDDRSLSVFCSSKMQTEAALWKWFEVRKPRFVLNTVLPDTLWGHVLDPTHQRNPLSVEVLKSVYEGTPSDHPPCNVVDVQDCALLHIAALILPDIEAQRIFAVSVPWNMKSLVQLLQRLHPRQGIQSQVSDLGVDQTVFKEGVNAEMILRRMGREGWTDMETSVKRNCEAFS